MIRGVSEPLSIITITSLVEQEVVELRFKAEMFCFPQVTQTQNEHEETAEFTVMDLKAIM